MHLSQENSNQGNNVQKKIEKTKLQIIAVKGAHIVANRDYALLCELQVCRWLIFGKRTKGQLRVNRTAVGRLMEQNFNARGC